MAYRSGAEIKSEPQFRLYQLYNRAQMPKLNYFLRGCTAVVSGIVVAYRSDSPLMKHKCLLVLPSLIHACPRHDPGCHENQLLGEFGQGRKSRQPHFARRGVIAGRFGKRNS